MIPTLRFYHGKNIFVTGHTGFKGSWLCRILVNAGADVTGYALEPPTNSNLWSLLEMDKEVNSIIGDVRDLESLQKAFDAAKPDMVFHLAAQPIVRESYRDPVSTYATNVMGTVHFLECCRLSDSVKSVVNVTTDKVYKNNEWHYGYRETDVLSGFDPYSNSKSCSELVTESYKNAFFANRQTAISTARAGNVIGGGDFAADRIIPDCVRAVEKGEKIILRNPNSTRPYQHVLEALGAYLLIAERQWNNVKLAGSYNVGPDYTDCITTENLTKMFCAAWGNGAEYEIKFDSNAPHEANFLKLDCSKIQNTLNWKPALNIQKAVKMAVEWERARLSGGDIREVTDRQISGYFGGKINEQLG